MITRNLSRLAFGAAVIACAAPFAKAQDSGPLIDALVRKGILSDQEAEELRADMLRDFGGSSAGKVNLSSSLTSFKLSGDIRLRQQFESQSTTAAPDISNERSRMRLRFRLNGDFVLQKGWSAGFALETANANDSGNQTFQDASADYGIFLSRAYVGYDWNDFSFVGGKQKNIFYTTDLVWDSDINPQGLTEQYIWTINDKSVVTFRAGQLLMDDNNEASRHTTDSTDAWMFFQQAEVAQKLSNTVSLKAAPGVFFYNASTIGGVVNEDGFNGKTENLKVIVLPGELTFLNVGGEGRELRAYWDMAYNTAADDRVTEQYGVAASVDSDPLAWLVGLSYAYGKGKTGGDWRISADYREIGLGSIDPNINDSDFSFSNLNQKGFKFSGSYNINDFTSVNATYMLTEEKEPLPGAGPAVADLDSSDLLQLDLNVKF